MSIVHEIPGGAGNSPNGARQLVTTEKKYESVNAAMARRDILTGTAALSALALVSGKMAMADTKPNIVFILADDLGWKDVGYHGSDIKTPNIDKLAQTGARLEEFYVQPMCTPTRAALMTGRYPLRYGLQTAVIPSAGRVWARHGRMAAAAGAQTSRIRNGNRRQVASWTFRPEILAEPARVRLFLRAIDWRDRSLQARIARRDRLVPQ